MPDSAGAQPVGILLISGTHERAHYAFMLAAAAAAIGRPVTLFATNAGCHALMVDWSGLADADRDAAVRHVGVAGLAELRAAASELGTRLLVCESGLLMAGLGPAGLIDGVEIVGIPSFLVAVDGPVLTL